MEKLANIHPGEVLLEEFLIPMSISAYRLSKDVDIPQTRISQIIKGNRRITADTALRLSAYFGTTAKFWLGLQDDYDLEEDSAIIPEVIKSIRTRTPVKPEPLLIRSFSFSFVAFFQLGPCIYQ